ncbi:MAG: hypothetical protein IMHGJWDQ_002110 [Candidatus Fervidibacter sp.]
MKCPRCGTENLDERVYCWKCMAPLKSGAMGAMPSAAPRPVSPPPPTAQPVPAAHGKSFLVTALLAWFFGLFGLDRFYLGYIGLGILKLVTCGGFGLWALVDFILLLAGVLRDAEGNELQPCPRDLVITVVVVIASILIAAVVLTVALPRGERPLPIDLVLSPPPKVPP